MVKDNDIDRDKRLEAEKEFLNLLKSDISRLERQLFRIRLMNLRSMVIKNFLLDNIIEQNYERVDVKLVKGKIKIRKNNYKKLVRK